MSRKPDPDHVRALKGKPPALTAGEQVAFIPERPLPPDFLNKEAIKCWDRMAAELEKAGILVAISRDKLARYCQAWADYAEVIRRRNLLGAKRFDTTTETHKHLYSFWQRVVEQSHKIMSEFETEYGLTPAAATKVRRSYGGAKTPDQELDEFLKA